jgi:hypothetical protein
VQIVRFGADDHREVMGIRYRSGHRKLTRFGS